MKRFFCALLCGALLTTLSACGGSKQAPAKTETPEETLEETVTFTDDLDREITVAKPSRVAALIGSFADVWCLAGGRDTLVAAADDSWTQFDLDLPETVESLGAVKEPNVELLLAAEPDFVLGSTKTAADLELLNLLEQSGIPVAYFDISSFEDYLRMLDICTQLTGCPERYTQYGTEVQAQVEQAVARQDGSAPRVLYVRASGSSCKVKNSQGSVLGEMLAAMGCVNIADSETGLLENLSMETILAEDTDHIFVVLQGSDTKKVEQTLEQSLLSNPAWDELTAVREGRYHVMDQRLYNVKPNARWGEAYEKLADILYPEQ
ncbi:ABC transporter substrate-binding protein [Oscillibacter sp.]|uniref:ABC transporter substrate-binding protein n=1 Tax=Oscillibacter sp. TaxID=1945593 RepID=UPI001B50B4C9|nr:ABC transporter substrate-binding protein [Oscillibacter sp.]MBP3510207.1 ABC transporter substrate-binding protein [Oscillibacter sp.]